MTEKVTIGMLQQMKAEGRKIVGGVVYDYQMAQIVERAGVDIVSVGDSIGKNMWGQDRQEEVTLDQMVLACQGVRRGVHRALLNCDFPYGPLERGPDAAVDAAIRLVKEGGADTVKLDGAADHLDAVRAVVSAGVPVFAQLWLSPETAKRLEGPERDSVLKVEVIDRVKAIEQAGAFMIDFTRSGPIAGPAVVQALKIPVVGGMGGGHWLDGRITQIHGLIGLHASALDDNRTRYADLAKAALEGVNAYVDDVRSGKDRRTD